ncbi:Hsp20/alpha crystallin family protein [candidate division KSB1 bacterium]|nr:Hsp20/alpha crystallin family protein [candidate division KSB1 bacterium]
MTIVRWRGLNDLEALRKEMDQVFSSFMQGPSEANEETSTSWFPMVDIYETDEQYVIKAELAGMNKEDVKINISENNLTLKGEKKETEIKESNTRFHRRERVYGNFQRTFSLPYHVDPQKVSAEYKDGLLSIILPKKEEVKPKEIQISVG